jgi:predicted NBD/HSP70 family sugar kinase
LRLFGIGIEVGTPVHDGKIMPAPSTDTAASIDLSAKVERYFAADDDFEESVAVVVENDVNALAVLAMHEANYAEPDMAVVSVFDEGVGGGLVMDGRLRRGSTGRAMETGHLAVGDAPGQMVPPPRPNRHANDDEPTDADASTSWRDFQQPCQCGQYGHLDTLATPNRIQGELRAADWERATRAPAFDLDGEPTREHDVFRQAGSALGRAVGHVCNIVNPGRLIIYLPASLAASASDTAGTVYRTAATSEINGAFATAGQSSEFLEIRSPPATPKELAQLGTKAAAVCVLESFIEHALRLDGCAQGQAIHSRTSRASA